MNIIKKLCCCLAILLVLFVFAGTIYAEKNPVDFSFPEIHTTWVVDQNSGIKLMVLSSKAENEAEAGVVYEWQGSSLNGYAHGVGIVNEYKNGAFSATYRGTFDHGKMQGHFIGKSYGKNDGDFEWNCIDGNLDGKFIATMKDGKLELIAKNKKFISGLFSIKRAEGFIEAKVANGDIVSVNLQYANVSYEGGFNKAGMNGIGVLKITNGITYEGEFLNNKMHGKGKLTYPNGNVYVGDFVAGEFNGYGTLYDADGNIIKQGNWEKNKPVASAQAAEI